MKKFDEMMRVTPYHPCFTLAHLGYLPDYLDSQDPRTMRDQLDANYAFAGGWRPIAGFKLLDGRTLVYPGDPPLEPLARIELAGRAEFAYFYQHDIVAIVQPNGSYSVARMD